MDGKGRAPDINFVERLWRSVKYEVIYPNDYASPREARQSLRRYLAFSNHERPHQALNYQTPADVYFHHTPAGQRSPGQSRDRGL